MKHKLFMVNLQLIVAGCALILPQRLHAQECSDLMIQFVDPVAAGHSQQLLGDRNVTAVIPCDRDASAPTVLHFIDHRQGQLCMSQRTCGNVRLWQGAFAVSGGWSDLTVLGDFHLLRDSLRYSNDWNGFRLVATFALSRGSIERDCTELGAPTCLNVFK